MLYIRGAITVEANEKTDILHQTKQLLQGMIERNQLALSAIRCVLFTATRDLDAAYPAVAARELGLTQAALVCVQELHVEGSLPLCIRATVVAEGDAPQAALHHVYLDGAAVLRTDFIHNGEAET